MPNSNIWLLYDNKAVADIINKHPQPPENEI